MSSHPPCYHCSLPSSPEFQLDLDGAPRDFCCIGCQAVASSIFHGGLGHFYEYRKVPSDKVSPSPQGYDAYDLREVQADFVSDVRSERSVLRRANIIIDGITCAACVWLIEKQILAVSGVKKVGVNANSHQGFVEFDESIVKLSDIFGALASIGFTPSPNSGQNSQSQWQQRQRSALLRLGAAGIGMMQAGMVSVALHAGAIQGITADLQNLLRWASLVLATPVLLYCGLPFFIAAWRALKTRHLTMDVPVSLALILAYLASVFATLTATGEVYFDSIAMFTFFLLLGRYLEQRVRYNNFLRTGQLQQLIPLVANKKFDNSTSSASISDDTTAEAVALARVPVKSLLAGDQIWVASGETFPCDGRVINGHSSANESLLTGESLPQVKNIGDEVVAGSQNIESGLWLEVTAVGLDTRLSSIENLVASAASSKPEQVAFADRVATYFVAAVLVVSVLVACTWLFIDPHKALWVTLSVLVVTCPCALSLATPAALTSALSAIRNKGVLVTSGAALESFTHITDIVFDKTGTLTEGKLRVSDIKMLDSQLTEDEVLKFTAALQRVSEHPIADAFTTWDSGCAVQQAKAHVARGVEGDIQGQHWRVGKPDFCVPDLAPQYPSSGLWLAVSIDQRLVAWLKLEDTLRESAEQAIDKLKRLGKAVHLVSGDRHANVEEFALSSKFDAVVADCTPAQKLDYVNNLQATKAQVLMVGDGINDVPVLAAADVSIAMGQASDLARLQSSAILLSNNLMHIPETLQTSQRVAIVIRQNLGWALFYNVCALPLAAAGIIPPWLAAIGMSTSSLVVVLNALRLTR